MIQRYIIKYSKINIIDIAQYFVCDFKNKLYQDAEKVKNRLNNNEPNYIYANVVIQSYFELQKLLVNKYLNFL